MKEELYIEHFGPIIEARVSINKITVLIGRQGSGKSTIANSILYLCGWRNPLCAIL